MSRKKQSARLMLILSLVIFVTLACDPFVYLPGGGSAYPSTTEMIPTPTPLCGGNVTGSWSGDASGGSETYTYTMSLTQNGCMVTGSSLTAGTTSASVNGYVDRGVFHFTESGPGNNCYWTANLTLFYEGNQLTDMEGNVTNCSQKLISLSRN
jgi:hypothetical protein